MSLYVVRDQGEVLAYIDDDEQEVKNLLDQINEEDDGDSLISIVEIYPVPVSDIREQLDLDAPS